LAPEPVELDVHTATQAPGTPMIPAESSPDPPDDLPPEPPRVTLADYRALERKVEMMMRLLGM
ncbi:MAG: hypothetical protein LUD38_05975, partial [Parabacteroides sp.]|nr:hypothetical protein [Parabacteroides sp.]